MSYIAHLAFLHFSAQVVYVTRYSTAKVSYTAYEPIKKSYFYIHIDILIKISSQLHGHLLFKLHPRLSRNRVICGDILSISCGKTFIYLIIIT
jgi:hypothetical protein